MGLIQLILVLVAIGVILWLVNSFIPMEARIKQILNVVVIIAVVLWLLALFLPGLGNIHVGPIRG